MEIMDVKTLRSMDERAIKEYGIPGILLMEAAASSLLRHINPSLSYAVILCGRGNNGGDGIALAIKLFQMGKEVDLYLLNDEDEIKGDASVFYQMANNMEIPMTILREEEDLWSFQEALGDADLIVDALYGTGFHGEMPPFIGLVIDMVNEYQEKVMAVDVPSGLLPDQGTPSPHTVHANKTVTFEAYKKGFFSYEAMPYLGEVLLESVGIPKKLKAEMTQSTYFVTEETACALLPRRRITGHKNTYGRVLAVAGSQGFTGAAMLSVDAAVASGSGLVVLTSFDETLRILVPRLTEVMSLPLEKLETGVRSAQAVAFGPGLGQHRDVYKMLLRTVKTLQEEKESRKTLVLDADGLRAMVGKCDLFEEMSFPVIITPHPGEMSILSGISKEELEKNRLETAKSFAKKHEVVVVLKGYYTVVTDGERTYVNSTGSSAMAQGGMGDALTGIIASFAGQGLHPLDAAVLGVYIHGAIGDELSQTRYTVKPSGVVENIPKYLKKLLDKTIVRERVSKAGV